MKDRICRFIVAWMPVRLIYHCLKRVQDHLWADGSSPQHQTVEAAIEQFDPEACRCSR